MGVFNRVISIVVLILALIAAGLAFLLSQKREALIDGWDKMASSINSTAKTLDQGSGTKVALQLEKKDLAHTNYKDLEKILPNLNKQAGAVVEQRDALSKALVSVAQTLEIDNAAEEADLKEIDKYVGSKDELLKLVERVQQTNEGLRRKVSQSAKQLNLDIMQEDLKNPDRFSREMDKFDQEVKGVKTRIDSYSSHIREVADTVGKDIDLRGEDYKDYLNGTSGAVRDLKKQKEQLEKELEIAKSENRQKIQAIDKNLQEISTLKTSEKELQEKIDQLQVIIQGGDKATTVGKEEVLLVDNDPQVLKMVQGKVIEVNDKWGFVVVNVGKETKVKQKYGNSENIVSAPIPKDEDMLVSRGGKYVGKIKLVKVYDDCSIGNILKGPTGDNHIQVGDLVAFSDDTVDKLLEEKENKNKPAESAEKESAPAAAEEGASKAVAPKGDASASGDESGEEDAAPADSGDEAPAAEDKKEDKKDDAPIDFDDFSL